MKYAVLTSLLIILVCFNSNKGFAQPGDLDASFNTSGYNQTDGDSRTARKVAIQADGKIVVGAFNDNIMLCRFNTDGTLDTSFGNNGYVSLNLYSGYYNEYLTDFVVRPDGKIVVIANVNSVPAMIRFLPNGILDSGFGNNGIVSRLGVTGTNAYTTDIFLLPDWSMLVYGRATINSVDVQFLEKFTSEGRLDNTYGNSSNGYVFIDQTFNGTSVSAISMGNDHYIYISGHDLSSHDPASDNYGNNIFRLTLDGQLDTNFGTNGYISSDITPHNDIITDIVEQPDGKVVITGCSRMSDTLEIISTARYLPSGELDTGFGNNGVILDTLGDAACASSLLLQPNGKILVAGYGGVISGTWSYDFYNAVIRYDQNGQRDTSFNSDGLFELNQSTSTDTLDSIALQPDGKIIATGTISGASYTGYNVVILRLEGDQYDISPNPVSISVLSNPVDTGSPHYSDTINVTGIDNDVVVPVSISYGEYDLNHTAEYTTWGMVNNGDNLQIKHRASDIPNGITTTSKLSIGGINTGNNKALLLGATEIDFSVTTIDSMPDPYYFDSQTNVDTNSVVVSNSVTLVNFDLPTTISVAGGEYSINGQTFTSTPGVVNENDQLRVRHSSPDVGGTNTVTTLNVGGIEASFTSTTYLDSQPDPYDFNDDYNAELGVARVSDPVTITGINISVGFFIYNGQYSINGGPFVSPPPFVISGSLHNGDVIQVQHVTETFPGLLRTTTVSIGSETGDFNSFTPYDQTPNIFSFDNSVTAYPNQYVESNEIVISGLNTVAGISVTNGEYSVNGAAFTSEDSVVYNNDHIRVKNISSSSQNGTNETYLTVGTLTEKFTSTTVFDNSNQQNNVAQQSSGGAFSLDMILFMIFLKIVTRNRGTIRTQN